MAVVDLADARHIAELEQLRQVRAILRAVFFLVKQEPALLSVCV